MSPWRGGWQIALRLLAPCDVPPSTQLPRMLAGSRGARVQIAQTVGFAFWGKGTVRNHQGCGVWGSTNRLTAFDHNPQR
eukprot:7587681-Pyramimonas_sp.AAC.1